MGSSETADRKPLTPAPHEKRSWDFRTLSHSASHQCSDKLKGACGFLSLRTTGSEYIATKGVVWLRQLFSRMFWASFNATTIIFSDNKPAISLTKHCQFIARKKNTVSFNFTSFAGKQSSTCLLFRRRHDGQHSYKAIDVL